MIASRRKKHADGTVALRPGRLPGYRHWTGKRAPGQLAINVMGAGVFMMLIAVAYRGPDLAPDPVPHALVLTGIVVAVSATALALALARRLDREQDDG
jgi:hypothetical protein